MTDLAMTPGPLAVGDAMPARTVHITRDDVARYAAASGDDNPIHRDDAAARAIGLPSVVAHGMLTLGIAMAAVAEWVGPGWTPIDFGGRFVKPVPVPVGVGAELTVAATVADRSDDGTLRLDLVVTSAGVKVLGAARAEVRPG